MNKPIFITGIGTDVGKTLVAAIVTEALQADYWKPVQAGFENGTDAGWVGKMLTNRHSVVYPETHRLALPASPHIAAKEENINIQLNKLLEQAKDFQKAAGAKQLIIEGAGGLLVPLSDTLLIADFIKALDAKVIIVSRNYLGSINHSLLTAAYCQSKGLDVAGWIFNDNYLQYTADIEAWTGIPAIASIPHLPTIDQHTIQGEATRIAAALAVHFH
jgi:dethiobiotin synthetase